MVNILERGDIQTGRAGEGGVQLSHACFMLSGACMHAARNSVQLLCNMTSKYLYFYVNDYILILT